MKKKRDGFGFGAFLVSIPLFIYFILIVYPLIWMVISSFKPSADIYRDTWGLPAEWKFSNYATAWERGISNYFVNSIIVTGATILLLVFIASLCAYALSRFDFKGKKFFLLACIGGMTLSPQVSLIPLYKIIQALGIHDTRWALILPYTAYRIPLIVLLMRSYFLSIPKEIEESATIDGCSPFGVYRRIFLPLSKPIIMTSIILTAYYAWNEFLFAIIFIDSNEYKTIPSGLMNFKDALLTDWGVLIAGLVIAALPITIMFLLMQKHFVRGMTAGSTKG